MVIVMDKMNVKLIQRIAKTQTEDVLHSSAYAGAQNGESFGAASAESFRQRQSIEEQRKFVRGYRNSRIIGTSALSGPKAKSFEPTKSPLKVIGKDSAATRAQMPVRPMPVSRPPMGMK